MKKVLITGGTGYIGSHTAIDLIANGFEVISIDNYSRSSSKTIERIEQITGKPYINYSIDLKDFAQTYQVFEQHNDIVGVIHFAAYKSVGESMQKPLMYYENNIMSLINVLKCMQAFSIKNLIFSSSCAVYGNSDEMPVTEDTAWNTAESPYGYTKQIAEVMIKAFQKVYTSLNTINLRYFNPAGAHESGKIGEDPTVVNTQLVPLIIDTVQGKRDHLSVFGDDYDTKDGSCVRDYIWIMDLANAHTKALQRLQHLTSSTIHESYNIGIGDGMTVLEAIQAFEKVNDVSVNYKVSPRRNGDVAAIYAKNNLAKEALQWLPKGNTETIMKTAWLWALNKSK